MARQTNWELTSAARRSASGAPRDAARRPTTTRLMNSRSIAAERWWLTAPAQERKEGAAFTAGLFIAEEVSHQPFSEAGGAGFEQGGWIVTEGSTGSCMAAMKSCSLVPWKWWTSVAAAPSAPLDPPARSLTWTPVQLIGTGRLGDNG